MGLIPFCSTFAMFGAGRAYEQIRNSIAYPQVQCQDLLFPRRRFRRVRTAAAISAWRTSDLCG